jgi:hypothetical protein
MNYMAAQGCCQSTAINCMAPKDAVTCFWPTETTVVVHVYAKLGIAKE